jgi:hypothetical protein
MEACEFLVGHRLLRVRPGQFNWWRELVFPPVVPMLFFKLSCSRRQSARSRDSVAAAMVCV